MEIDKGLLEEWGNQFADPCSWCAAKGELRVESRLFRLELQGGSIADFGLGSPPLGVTTMPLLVVWCVCCGHLDLFMADAPLRFKKTIAGTSRD